MKRFHVHVSVSDLDASVRFYSSLVAATPAVLKADYAKWMLDDPLVNFAISTRGAPVGIEHLGIQDGPVVEEGETVCCYAKSEKRWIEDPQGVRWETFLPSGESTVYGRDAPDSAACCVPVARGDEAGGAAACCTAEDRARARAERAACCG